MGRKRGYFITLKMQGQMHKAFSSCSIKIIPRQFKTLVKQAIDYVHPNCVNKEQNICINIK